MKPLIVALDVDTEKEALSLIKATQKYVDIFKVGPPLILRYGPSILKKIKAKGKKIFLDMKFHDIPNTMKRSLSEAGKTGIYSATVHLSAGEKALQMSASLSPKPRIWGVSVLTSLSADDLIDIGLPHTPLEQTLRLAQLAKKTKIDGIVASVGETAELRGLLGPKFTIITPGIRLPNDSVSDQKRIATPQHARGAGSTFMVVGRPILDSKDPGETARDMIRDWNRGSTEKR